MKNIIIDAITNFLQKSNNEFLRRKFKENRNSPTLKILIETNHQRIPNEHIVQRYVFSYPYAIRNSIFNENINIADYIELRIAVNITAKNIHIVQDKDLLRFIVKLENPIDLYYYYWLTGARITPFFFNELHIYNAE